MILEAKIKASTGIFIGKGIIDMVLRPSVESVAAEKTDFPFG